MPPHEPRHLLLSRIEGLLIRLGEPAFVAAPFGLLRLPALPPERARLTTIDLDPEDPAEADRMTVYIRELIADRVLREALEVSSGSLARTLQAIESGRSIPFARLRRTVYTLTNYLIRMSCRPTPFGLMAGVAVAEFGEVSGFRLGRAARKVVRPDMEWLLELVGRLERDPDVLGQLQLTCNDTLVVRGDRLVLPGVRDNAPGDDTVHEVSVRNTAAVRRVLEATRDRVHYPELVDSLLAVFPGAQRAIVGMVDQLIAQDFLLTDLRPPADTADPLSHVLDRLAPFGDRSDVRVLREISEAVDAYADQPPGGGTSQLRSVRSTMARLHPREQLLQVDLRMDAQVSIPDMVARELAAAVDALWRIAPDTSRDHLAEYHEAFVERYGHGQAVGVKELLDPERGLGPPAGYLWPPSARHAESRKQVDHSRQQVLADLAQGAHQDGGHEVVVDDALLATLAIPDRDTDPPPGLDVCASLLADSPDRLADGDFRLVLSDHSWAAEPGAFFGRFLHLLDGTAERIATLVSQPHVVGDDALAAQVQLQPTTARLRNVTQVPRILSRRIVIGAYQDRADDRVLGLDDLAVAADRHRFHVLSRADGRAVVPMFFHMLNPVTGLPNAARLLLEIAQLRHRTLSPWPWGGLSRLPFLPRVRYGRTVLSAARWLPAPGLLDRTLSWPQWCAELDTWRKRWAVPDRVDITSWDNRIAVDLSAPLHQRVLRRELGKDPQVVLTEPPAGGEFGTGWCDGYANEIAVPMIPRPDAARPTRLPATTVVRTIAQAHRPGGEWLYAKLYVADEHQDELLAEHLPDLLDRVRDLTDRWFFLRFRDPDPHLRVRIHGEPSAVNGRILPLMHEWAAASCDAGLMRRLVLDTYEPESARYGGDGLLALAEQAFSADSDASITQLQLLRDGRLTVEPLVLAAANHVSLATQLWGEEWTDRFLASYPKRAADHAAFKARRSLACQLIDPAGGWAALAEESGGDQVIAAWQERAPALAAYGAALGSGDTGRVEGAVTSMLHMHANRLLGIRPDLESRSYAVARGAVQAACDRARFGR